MPSEPRRGRRGRPSSPVPHAGERNRLIELQRATKTTDSSGQEIQTWTTFAVVWARVRPVEARERFRLEAAEASEIATFESRHRADLTAADRVFYQAKPWNIRGLAEQGVREGLEITAEARA